MHTVATADNAITVHFNSDWSGEVILTWHVGPPAPLGLTGVAHLDASMMVTGMIGFDRAAESVPVGVLTQAVAIVVAERARRLVATALDKL